MYNYYTHIRHYSQIDICTTMQLSYICSSLRTTRTSVTSTLSQQELGIRSSLQDIRAKMIVILSLQKGIEFVETQSVLRSYQTYTYVWGCSFYWETQNSPNCYHYMIWKGRLVHFCVTIRASWSTKVAEVNSLSASHDNWCTATLLNRIITAQWEGMGDVGSARYEPALLLPCPTKRVLCYSNCERSTHSHQQFKG